MSQRDVWMLKSKCEVVVKAFLVKQQDGSFLDTIIIANDETEARTLITEEAYSIGEVRQDVAAAMGVNADARKRHDGALTRWIIGPTKITGELI